MSQSEQFGEAWAYLRDNARPVVPDDVYYLREIRADMPPSRAHIKRLKKSRPEIVPTKPRGTSCATARLRANEAAAHGRAIADLLGYVKPIVR